MPIRMLFRFQFPTLWDEDCNFVKKSYVATVTCSFQFPTLWDEDCNLSNLNLSQGKSWIFQFPTLWDEDCNWPNAVYRKMEGVSFSSLHFGMKTAISLNLSRFKITVSLSVPYTLGWRLHLEGGLWPTNKLDNFQFPTLWDEDCNKISSISRWEIE